jgi:tetratricopeptide (TPR) repeat protein
MRAIDKHEQPVARAMALLLRGRRAAAIESLVTALRSAPADGALLHAYLLCCCHTAASSRGPAGYAEAARLWRSAIAAWACLAHRQEFWRSWIARALERYGVDPAGSRAGVLGPLQRRIRERLESELDAGTDPALLRLLLERELAAAAELKRLGGLPAAADVGPDAAGGEAPAAAALLPRLVCGPLMIHLLGLGRLLGGWLRSRAFPSATASPSPSRGDPAAAAGGPGCRRAFSSLGLVQAELDAGRPAAAVTAVRDLRCGECRAEAVALPPEAGPAGWQPLLCPVECSRFEELHPAWSALPDREEALRREALALAAEALSSLAGHRLSVRGTDLAGAAAAAREAMRLAGLCGGAGVIGRRLGAEAAARVEALEADGRRGEAVACLEAVRGILRRASATDGLDEIEGRLANHLADRGITAANDEPPRWSEATSDLRRALALNPHTLRPRLNLARILEAHAELQRIGTPDAALDGLEEAFALLTETSDLFPGRADVEDDRRRLAGLLAEVVHGRAWDLEREGGFEAALALLRRGLNRLPADPLLAAKRSAVYRCWAERLLGQGRRRAAEEVAATAERELTDDPAAAADLAALRRALAGDPPTAAAPPPGGRG